MSARQLTYLKAFNEGLRQVMDDDPDVFVAGEDVGRTGGVFHSFDGLVDQFGERRMVDTPIAEQAIIGLGIGAAVVGLRPIVDGMDAIAVHDATRQALETIRAGEGPSFLECKTYRYYNHHGIQTLGMKYRSDDEVEEWRGRDAIDALERVMVADGVATEADIEAARAAVQAEVDAAIEFAESSPLPDPGELLDNVNTETDA